ETVSLSVFALLWSNDFFRGRFRTIILFAGIGRQVACRVSRRRYSHAHHPVDDAATTAAEYDRVTDGPATISLRFPVESHQRPVREPRSVSTRGTASHRGPRLPGGGALDPQDRRPLEIFTVLRGLTSARVR